MQHGLPDLLFLQFEQLCVFTPDAASSDQTHLRSLEAASPAWTRKQTIVRIHQQVHQAADPIPIIYLLLSPGRTLSANNCEHSPLRQGWSPIRSRSPAPEYEQLYALAATRARSSLPIPIPVKIVRQPVTRRSKCRPRLAHV